MALSLFYFEYLLTKKELRANRLSCVEVLSSSLVFSLCFSLFIFSTSYNLSPDLLLQTPFFLFTVFHFSLWNISLLLFASHYPRCSSFFLVLALLLVSLIKLNQRLYIWDASPSLFLILKLSPYANLANGSLSLFLGRNFFFGGYMRFETDLLLLLIYSLTLDALTFFCCHSRPPLLN